MKKNLFTLIILLFSFYSCKNNKTSIQTTHKEHPTIASKKTIHKGFFVDDPSKYSLAFIDSLKASSFADSTKLIKNHIVVGKDSATFPKDLKLNHLYIFKGRKDSTNYILTVKRINLTDIAYDYYIKKDNSTLFKDKGTVTLNPMFFLGSENPDDSESGEGYSAFEYMYDDKNSFMYIGIGTGLDDNKKLRAYMKKSCKGKKSLTIPEELTLRADAF